MFLTVPRAKSLAGFWHRFLPDLFLVLLKDTFADFATLVR